MGKFRLQLKGMDGTYLPHHQVVTNHEDCISHHQLTELQGVPGRFRYPAGECQFQRVVTETDGKAILES